MNKYVCYLTVPQKWDFRNVRPISLSKIEYIDLAILENSLKYQNAIYAIGDTKEEAFQKAKKIQIELKEIFRKFTI